MKMRSWICCYSRVGGIKWFRLAHPTPSLACCISHYAVHYPQDYVCRRIDSEENWAAALRLLKFCHRFKNLDHGYMGVLPEGTLLTPANPGASVLSSFLVLLLNLRGHEIANLSCSRHREARTSFTLTTLC